ARARQCCDQRSVLIMMQLNMASVSQRGAISHERMLGFVQRLDEELAELKAFYVSESLRIGALRSAAEHTITMFGFPYSPRPVQVETDFAGISSPLIEYYSLKAQSLGSDVPPQQKVEAAQQAVEVLMSLSDENISLRRERIIALSNCGALLMTIANDYPAAAAMNLRALELMKQYRLGEIDVQVYYNYCSALMKSKEYAQVLRAIGEHEEKLISDQRVGFRFSILKTFALIFLRDWQTAMKTLPQYINRYPENEYHYAWFQLSIIAYLRGDPDDALREIQNFAKRFSRRNLDILQPHQHELVNAFRSFYHAVLESNNPKRMAKFLATARKNLEKAISTGIFIPDYLPIVWLRGELESFGKHG
ncbi:MAG: hypothetical protein JNL32_14240, partial [Candidatus Kapabacteria bacterium]|nr:hypothetical protein [Candidatus Kapabacteria bacterium]